MKLGIGIVVGCVAASWLAAAWAQDPDPLPAEEPPPVTDTIPVAPEAAPSPAEPRATGRVSLVEIVVTAQKREENIQDVPIAISAFSGDALEAKGIDDAQTLQTVTPGLVFDSIGNFSVIYLRGVGTDAFIPSADLSVATYIDGVYFPFSYSIARSLGDVERLEILKGPQGTLFGRNTTAGAINITTRDPPQEFKVTLDASAARFHDHNYKVSVGGPIFGDALTAVISGLYAEKDEHYEFVEDSTQQSFQPYRDKGLFGKLRWKPAGWFDATAGAFHITSQGPNTVIFKQLDPSTIGDALGLTVTPGDYKLANDAPSFAFNKSSAEYLTLAFHPAPLDIKIIGSHQELYGSESTDFDGTQKTVAVFGGGDDNLFDQKIHDKESGQINEVKTAEIQFLSNDESWGSNWFNWIGGFFWYDATAGFVPVRLSAAGIQDLLTVPQLPVPIDLSLLDPLLDIINAAPTPNLGVGIEVNGLLDTKSWAGFGQTTIKPFEWLDITLGGRYTQEKRRVYGSNVNALAKLPTGEVVSTPVFNYANDRTSNNKFSPKAVVAVHPWDDVMVYASWQEGFKSGSFNIVNITEPPSLIRPEVTRTSELGVKSDWFGGRVRVNAAAYYTKIKDLQSQFLSLLAGGVVSFENAQKATVKGVDLDVTWAVTPALILTVSGNVLDGVYDKFEGVKGFDSTTRLYNDNNDFSGNTIVRNPDFTGSIALNYSLEVPGGLAEFGADAYYNSGFFYDPGHTSEQDPYHVFNARMSYLYEAWQLRLTAFGTNLDNSERYLFQFPNDFGTVGKLAPPRVFGMRVDWTFGG